MNFGNNLKCITLIQKNVMRLYEVENVDNQNICTIAINPKEYFENFKIEK